MRRVKSAQSSIRYCFCPGVVEGGSVCPTNLMQFAGDLGACAANPVTEPCCNNLETVFGPGTDLENCACDEGTHQALMVIGSAVNMDLAAILRTCQTDFDLQVPFKGENSNPACPPGKSEREQHNLQHSTTPDNTPIMPLPAVLILSLLLPPPHAYQC